MTKEINIIIVVIVIVDIALGVLLFTNRAFSHLAVWNIKESIRIEDFYPEHESAPLVDNENKGFDNILKSAVYMRNHSGGNCFDRSIAFLRYLGSIGIKSRLWAMENKLFDGIAHTVIEVYSEELKKWVFMDVHLGFYVKDGDNYLSLLELRDSLLADGGESGLVYNVDDSQQKNRLPKFYARLITCVFLRANNNFDNKYIWHNRVSKAITYLVRRDLFLHYADKYSPRLLSLIIVCKILFYFFLISGIALIILAVVSLLKQVFQKKRLSIHK